MKQSTENDDIIHTTMNDDVMTVCLAQWLQAIALADIQSDSATN